MTVISILSLQTYTSVILSTSQKLCLRPLTARIFDYQFFFWCQLYFHIFASFNFKFSMRALSVYLAESIFLSQFRILDLATIGVVSSQAFLIYSGFFQDFLGAIGAGFDVEIWKIDMLFSVIPSMNLKCLIICIMVSIRLVVLSF